MSLFEFPPKSTTIRRALQEHRSWIEAQLNTRLADCIQLRFETSLTAIATHLLLPEFPFADTDICDPILRKKVQKVALPPDSLPAISLSLVADVSTPFATRKSTFEPSWLDCPVAFHLEGVPVPVITMNIPYISGAQHCGDWREVTIVRRDCMSAMLRFMQERACDAPRPGLHHYPVGFSPARRVRWEDLTLDLTVKQLLWEDFEAFFRRESWFRDNNLPFRRGYLLHGAPGNGKTSAVCAMLSRPGMTGHTINLSIEQVDDNDLSGLFNQAARTAPSIIVLEDLDRYFNSAHKEKQHSSVSLQHLLNCLDGVGTQEGIIVVATANHPQGLDPAILRRPGRFDRVIEFPNPCGALRSEYFQRLVPLLTPAELAACSEACRGFSFAQLKESFVLAGHFAFDEQRHITASDIISATDALRASLDSMNGRAGKAPGFKVS